LLPLSLALCLTALLVVPKCIQAAELVRAPYLQNATPSSITLRWMTDVPAESHVSWTPASGGGTSSIHLTTPVIHHEVEITGLAAATQYTYVVSDENGLLVEADEARYFRTSPLPGTQARVRIWAIGDSGAAGAYPTALPTVLANKLAHQAFLNSTPADLMLLMGDNAYLDGTEAEFTNGLFEPFADVLQNVPSWSAIGNHDLVSLDSASTGPYFDAVTHPVQGEGGGVPSGSESYFSFDYGNVHVISLHSFIQLVPDRAQYDWLAADLLQNTATFTIVMMHVSPYSKGSHDSDTDPFATQIRSSILPLLEQHGVDLVLSGHSHGYERSMLIDGHYGLSNTCAAGECVIDARDGNPTPPFRGYKKSPTPGEPHDGTVYAVIGHGSSSRTDEEIGLHPVMAIKAGVVGSMVIDIEGDRLDAFMIDRFGAVRDHFRISKSPPGVPFSTRPGQAVLLFGLGLVSALLLSRSSRSRAVPRE
jgi:hypothetical protein